MKKIKSLSYGTMSLTTGLLGYSYLIYNKLKKDRQLDHPVVKEVLDMLKNDKRVTEIIGNQFLISTGLLSSLSIKAQNKDNTMEYSFRINGTKNKSLSIFFVATGSEHEQIKKSKDWKDNEAEYFIPDKYTYKLIEETEDKELLKKIEIRDEDLFWKLDFVEGIKDRREVIDVKSDIKLKYNNLSLTKRSNLFDLYTILKVR